MYKLIIITATILCAASASALTYEWTDKTGVVNFTDSPEIIPPAYLDHTVVKDDITTRDPKIRDEVRRDEERAQQEESAAIPRNALEPAPVSQSAAQASSEDKSAKPEATSPQPVWNLCAPGRPLTVACAPGPLKRKGG